MDLDYTITALAPICISPITDNPNVTIWIIPGGIIAGKFLRANDSEFFGCQCTSLSWGVLTHSPN